MWGYTGAAAGITLCQDILMWKQSTSCNHLMPAFQSLRVGMLRSIGHWSLLDDIIYSDISVVGWLLQKKPIRVFIQMLQGLQWSESWTALGEVCDKYCSAVSDSDRCSFWPQAKSVGKPTAAHFHSHLFPHVVLFFGHSPLLSLVAR